MIYAGTGHRPNKLALYDGSPGGTQACVTYDMAGVDPVKLDPVLLKFENRRAAQKAKFGGELFPAHFRADALGRTYLDFFQTDKTTGALKGIIAIDLMKVKL